MSDWEEMFSLIFSRLKALREYSKFLVSTTRSFKRLAENIRVHRFLQKVCPGIYFPNRSIDRSIDQSMLANDDFFFVLSYP